MAIQVEFKSKLPVGVVVVVHIYNHMPSSAATVRRAQDAAALLAYEALDSNADVERIVLPLFAAASLSLPKSVSSQPRDKLLQLVNNTRASAARSVDAANNSEVAKQTDASEQRGQASLGLSNDASFRTFMGLKLQAVEGSQVRTILRRALGKSPPPCTGLQLPAPPLHTPHLTPPHTPSLTRSHDDSQRTPPPTAEACRCAAQCRGAALLRLHRPRCCHTWAPRPGGAPSPA